MSKTKWASDTNDTCVFLKCMGDSLMLYNLHNQLLNYDLIYCDCQNETKWKQRKGKTLTAFTTVKLQFEDDLLHQYK